MENQKKEKLSNINQKLQIIIYIIFMVVVCLPSIIITLYTYPVQDDFYNTVVVMEKMKTIHSPMRAALNMAFEGYFNYSGYYFSLFLTYFSDAIVQCNITEIRIIQFIMVLSFYIILATFIYSISRQVMKFDNITSIQITTCLIICVTCLYYYSEHEDFYWFCASMIYLIPMMCIMGGIIFFINAILYQKNYLLILSATLGFLSGGAVLNIAALGCILYVMAIYWGIVVKKEWKKSLIGGLPMLIGGAINVIAPGNYIRRGTEITGQEIYKTLIGSILYALDRIKMFLLDCPIFPTILIILILLFLKRQVRNYQYKFWIPITFTLVMFISVVILIFPVALGYGMETYSLMERSNFISDISIYLFTFFCIFYWYGWFSVHISKINMINSKKVIINFIIVFVLGIGLFRSDISEIVPIRLAREILNGEIKEYSDWSISVIKKMEEDADEIVEIVTIWPDDFTTLINPKYYFGKYDPQKEFANRSMALFYNKKAIYIYECEK